MPWMMPSLIATISCTFVLVFVYLFLYHQYRQRFLAVWTWGWFIYLLRYIFEIWIQSGQKSTVLLLTNQILSLISGILLLWGTYIFLNKTVPQSWLYSFALGIGWVLTGILTNSSFALITLPTFLLLAVIFTWTGLVLIRSRDIQGTSKTITGGAFIMWGIHKLDYPFLASSMELAPWGYLLSAVITLIVAIGILLVYFQQTQKELTQSEEKYRRMAENAPDVVYRCRMKPYFCFDYINQVATTLTGYTPDEYYSDPSINYKLVHPDDWPLMEAVMKFEIEIGEPITLRWMHKDGTIIWVEQRHVPIHDEDGNLVALDGIARDITERKQYEDVLQRYQLMFENARDVILFINKEGQILEANKAARQTYGYSKEELTNLKVFHLRPGDTETLVNTQMEEAYQQGISFETVHVRKDGTQFPVEVNSQGTDIHGERIILSIVRNISERKQAEDDLHALNRELEESIEELTSAEEELKQQLTEIEDREAALRQSEAKFRKLFHNANDIIYLQTLPQEGQYGRYIEVNSVACQKLGYSRGELLSMNPLNIFDKEGMADFESAIETLYSKNFITFESKLLTKNGEPIPSEISSHLFMLGGQQVVLSIARDITERKIAQEQLNTAHQQLLDIIEFLPDPTFVIDKNSRVIAWNKAIEEMTGVSKNEMIKKGGYAHAVPFYGVPRPILADYIVSGSHEQYLSYEKINQKGSTLYTEVFAPTLIQGKGAVLWAIASPLYDSAGNLTGAIESIRDITDRKHMEEQLLYLSLHDPLTKLYNRNYFEEEMRRLENGRKHPLGVIMCDIDGLKLINDTMGHEAGDRLLLEAAKVIRGSFRGNDMVARFGGDEFAILVPNANDSLLQKACQRIKKGVDKYNSSHSEFHLSISVGYALGKVGVSDFNALFKEADNNMYREKLHSSQSARSAIVHTLIKTLEARDYITEGHCDRLQDLVSDIATRIGLSERTITDLRLLAQFHDIGKVGVPDRILFKPGPLNHEEFAEMKRHSEIGHRIALSSPALAPIADWILKHHEWWNGEGYPLGLKGEEIPLECRILAIADAYDAMVSNRPYRGALSSNEALAELKKCSGTQFDPQLTPIFIQSLEGHLQSKSIRS